MMPARLTNVVSRVGALIETPALFPSFSGWQNLDLLAHAGGLASGRASEVLAQVGLSSRGNERVAGYSLGMRQRLGIAIALLKRPELLILDEPTNGLDPGGIREVRDLVRALAQEGTTVLLSSHLLGEVKAVCDEVTIVHRGRTVVSGPLPMVAGRFAGEGVPSRRYRIGLVERELKVGAARLEEAGFVVEQGRRHLIVDHDGDGARLTRLLADAGLYVCELVEVGSDLEDVFLSLTGTGGDGDAVRQR